MEVTKISPPVSGFLLVKLDQEIIDYLWKIIGISKTTNESNKDHLAGNISQSLLLDDVDSLFSKAVCSPLVKYYRENYDLGNDPVSQNASLGNKSNLVLNKIWVNYQYKTEFNPYHDHTGVYSFAIWMKIPYDSEEQQKLPQFSDINPAQRKAGNFEFEYLDSLGSIINYTYRLSPKFEGLMVFFPARLRHCVYPFYDIDSPRISIAGNLSYMPA